MKILKLFPTLILGEVLNNISSKEILNYTEHCNNLELIGEHPNGSFSKNQKLLSNPLFSNLSSNILLHSKKLLNSLNHSFEDIQISTSWFNTLNKDEYIQTHNHYNSYISGVFYLTEGSSIVFGSPIETKYYFINTNSDTKSNSYNIKPEPNLLLLFPSYLYHKVLPSDLDNRISIAFNIIPKGEFGPDTGKLYL
tara:strand:- start:1497 stop:2081 length:585 start_codon:yes stop_codon:yes gene_type:complete